MNIYKDKFSPLHGYFEGGIDSVDEVSSKCAIEYKAEISRNYINLSNDQIDFRLGGTTFYITRKYDGELNVIFYNGEDIVIINRSGRVRMGLACLEDAKEALKKAGITQAILPSELYVEEENGRTRVFDVLNILADKSKIQTLRLAVFDILELDANPYRSKSYEETYQKIREIFKDSKLSHAVKYKKTTSKSEVKDIFKQWVEEEGAEGLVVRSELPLIYKIKPRYTIDTVVVGYSEGTNDTKGQIRSLLLAMMPAEGQYQIIGRTGNGFNEELKKELLMRLEPMIMESQYIETDSNHVAFHMVKPEIVIELMIFDAINDTSTGFIYNPILEISNNIYYRKSNVHGVSVVYPIFVRFREDKKAIYEDVRLSQINDFAYAGTADVKDSLLELKKSEIIKRVVYKKETNSKLMVQKFIVWKTNKEKSSFPAYVFHYTNFSSERKEPLQREVMISDSEEQIIYMFEKGITENIKKGWNLCE